MIDLLVQVFTNHWLRGVSRIWWRRDGGLWVWVVVGRGVVDRRDGFAFVEVCRGGFVCVCVCFAWWFDWQWWINVGFCLSIFLLSSFFSLIWVL